MWHHKVFSMGINVCLYLVTSFLKMKQYLCCVPLWNMCHPKTCYELAWCAMVCHSKNMCNSETCFRLALYKLWHGWMQDLEAYKLTQGEKKWGQMLGVFDCNDLKDIISALDVTKFAQHESEECFKMAHILEWHTMPIWKRFQYSF